MRLLKVGGIVVPNLSGLELGQTYEPLEAVARFRVMSGTLRQRSLWRGKLKTTITGRGTIPAGLQAIDYSAAVDIDCVAHRSITSASNVIALPAARRTDSGSLPYGRALVGSTWVPTACVVVTNVATLGAVAGASQYQVVYFPSLSCYATPPRETRDADGQLFSWELSADEV